jgi:putative FmdB family regulatory protein
MPLYECHCLSCDLTFEVLAPVSRARKPQPCPGCGRLSERIVSAFAIASGSSADKQQTQEAKPAPAKKNQRPLCLQYPHLPLLCHMDEKAAHRWIAHSKGRGSEFDDKMAKREELQKQRGVVPPKPAAASHGHSHDFRRHGKMKEDAPRTEHGHSHANGGAGGGTAKPQGHAQGNGKSHGHSHQTGHAHDH